MRKIVTVDRETASQINPLISSLWTEDTLDSVAAVVNDLGYILSVVAKPPEGTEPRFGQMCLLFGAISAALTYEVDNLHSIVQARKERHHG